MVLQDELLGIAEVIDLERADADEVSEDRAERAVADLLEALGFDLRGRLRETPRRVAIALRDLVTAAPLPASTFLPGESFDGPIQLRDIPFHSLCEHHLMPFRGTVNIAYLPHERIVGISTLPRVVEHFARDLQVQERLTAEIADWLELELQPRALRVTVDAEHQCMSLRGIGTPATRMTTEAIRGDRATIAGDAS
jgi:GTP cyclohydrolase I